MTDDNCDELCASVTVRRRIIDFLKSWRKRPVCSFRLLASAVLVGAVTGVGAVVFFIACQLVVHFALDAVAGYRPRGLSGEPLLPWLADTERSFHLWLLLITTTVGGLASGLIVFCFAPEAEGHGTDTVIAAYHHGQGQIRARVPLIKILATALTLGSGGSGGREGPITQIGAGFGSFLARLLRLGTTDRRILVAAGMGAGIAAIFRSPLAGTIFAAEVLYRSHELETEVLLPTGVASVVAYCTFGAFFGWQPLLATAGLSFDSPWQLGPYLILAVFMVVLATLYTRTFHRCTHLFRELRLPRHLKPAVGAFGSGLVGVLLYLLVGRQEGVLAVLSFGSGILQDALGYDVTLSGMLLLTVAIGKILTTSLTIGSGGSGGIFGPSMVIGGCGGGAIGVVLHLLWPTLVPHPAAFVVVGMAGFFAAAAKTPFAALLIVCEMTGSLELLVPALWVSTLAFALSDEQTIYSSQLDHRGQPAALQTRTAEVQGEQPSPSHLTPAA